MNTIEYSEFIKRNWNLYTRNMDAVVKDRERRYNLAIRLGLDFNNDITELCNVCIIK